MKTGGPERGWRGMELEGWGGGVGQKATGVWQRQQTAAGEDLKRKRGCER